jgi:phage-related protein
MADRKPVEFRDSALADLRAFPEQARRESGHQIDQVALAGKRYQELIEEPR